MGYNVKTPNFLESVSLKSLTDQVTQVYKKKKLEPCIRTFIWRVVSKVDIYIFYFDGTIFVRTPSVSRCKGVGGPVYPKDSMEKP